MVSRSATGGTYPPRPVLVPGRVVAGRGRVVAALLVLAVLLVEELLVERQSLVMERVTHPVALGAQVGLVVRVGDGLDRHLVADREAVALQPQDLLRIVREDADAGEAEVDQ